MNTLELITCTRCKHAKHYIPLSPSTSGWITCPFRKWNNTKHSGAPCVDAFPEFYTICQHFVDLDDTEEIT